MYLEWKIRDQFYKALLFGELNDDKRPSGSPKIRYKDTRRGAVMSSRITNDFSSSPLSLSVRDCILNQDVKFPIADYGF